MTQIAVISVAKGLAAYNARQMADHQFLAFLFSLQYHVCILQKPSRASQQAWTFRTLSPRYLLATSLLPRLLFHLPIYPFLCFFVEFRLIFYAIFFPFESQYFFYYIPFFTSLTNGCYLYRGIYLLCNFFLPFSCSYLQMVVFNSS